MSQSSDLLSLFKENGNRLTLGQILENWRIVGSKYTNRISEIREMGYTIECIEDKKEPTNNLYILGDSTSKVQTGAVEPRPIVSQSPIFYDSKKKSQQIFALGDS
jgi:hypothetical protein